MIFLKVYQPRSCMRCSLARVEISMPCMASPNPLDLGDDLRVVVMGHRFDYGLGANGRVCAFEYAGADEHAVGTELHHERCVGRSCYPPAAKLMTGRRCMPATSLTR